MKDVASTPEIDALLRLQGPVAIGVSGGKDSQAAVIATFAHLDRIGHTGPRLLIHSDLGVVEWDQSLPVCEVLARRFNVELAVVRRKAGDLMDRWEARWESSKRRYAALETVTLVPCWSTPSMRFCTSELKTHVIAAELKRRFKGAPALILNVTGVRRAESAARARGSVGNADADGKIYHWRPLSDWSTEDVFAAIAEAGLQPHQAYTEFGLSRVSCRFCIMSNGADLTAAAAVPEAMALYRRMVGLEIASSFAFQGARWLGDVRPEILVEGQKQALDNTKRIAAQRTALEKAIPRHMRLVNGHAPAVPTLVDSHDLAEIRKRVGEILGIDVRFTTADQVQARYREMLVA